MAFDINDPEDKKLLDDAVKKAVDGQLSGLISKRDELLDETKRQKEKLSSLSELQTKLEQMEADEAKKAGDWDKLETSLREKHASEIATLKTAADEQTAKINTLLIDNGLKEELIKAGVAKNFMPAVEALLRDKVEVAEINGTLAAVVDNKPLSEFVKEWAGTDEGGAFISAPENKGSGAPGGNNQGDGRTKSNEFTMGELSKMKADDPARYNAIVKNNS